MSGRLVTLLTKNHGELSKFVFATSVMTGFCWTLASGHPLVDPYRWLSGEETSGEGTHSSSIAFSALPSKR